ncbi:MAG: COX15/CtaA family protein [Burkholderiales bacterium]|nr:COX15/CtaA family protein [Burkholderiales bacterium]
MDRSTRIRVAAWLFACCVLLFTMIVIGGITRLTRSGLSIVEWQPIAGALPPLNEAQWLETFEKYRQTPEYKQVNFGMSLAEFKGIFWWEYIHRLLGRLIGLVFFIPYAWFLLRKRLDRDSAWKLGLVFVLGAIQGAMGWYMVKSGLVDDPRVSHYRLSAHLGLAFAIFAAMFWIALDMLKPRLVPVSEPARRLGRVALTTALLVFVMILSGGLVAGIRAGYAYNTFPLMNGHWIPPEILLIEPWYLNFFNNMATVQFDHRTLAWILLVLIAGMWIASRSPALPARARFAAHFLLLAIALQFSLGVAALLLRVPVPLGAAHQGGAVLVLAALLWFAHELRRPEH